MTKTTKMKVNGNSMKYAHNNIIIKKLFKKLKMKSIHLHGKPLADLDSVWQPKESL